MRDHDRTVSPEDPEIYELYSWKSRQRRQLDPDSRRAFEGFGVILALGAIAVFCLWLAAQILAGGAP